MLRRTLAPLDSYLGDAAILDEAAFIARYAWPMFVAPEPPPELKSRLQRPETVLDEIGDETTIDLMAPGMAAASLEALCLEVRPINPGQSRMRIGRSPSSDVVLIDQSVSRAHAEISWEPSTERAVLMDLDTKNGTTVDQRKLAPRQEAILVPGCTISFGSLVVRYYSPRTFRTWIASGAPRSGASPSKWPSEETD